MHLKGRLPKALIQKHYEQWLHDNELSGAQGEQLVGVSERFWSNRGLTIHWTRAERILLAMGRLDLWWADPELERHYLAVNLESEDPNGKAHLTRKQPGRQCSGRGCENRIDAQRARGGRVFCSDECRERYQQERREQNRLVRQIVESSQFPNSQES